MYGSHSAHVESFYESVGSAGTLADVWDLVKRLSDQLKRSLTPQAVEAIKAVVHPIVLALTAGHPILASFAIKVIDSLLDRMVTVTL